MVLSGLSALPAFAADMPKEDFSAISTLVQSWIDRKRGVHGVFLARVADSWNFKWKEFNPMLAGASLARLVGAAIDTEAGSLGRKMAKKEVTLGADQKPDAQARAANEDQKEKK